MRYLRELLPFNDLPKLDEEALEVFQGEERHLQTRNKALRNVQAGLLSVAGTLVALIQKRAHGPATDRQVVAKHVVAALSHLGKAFVSLSKERESVVARGVPQFLPLAAPDGTEEQHPNLLFGPSFFERLEQGMLFSRHLGMPQGRVTIVQHVGTKVSLMELSMIN